MLERRQWYREPGLCPKTYLRAPGQSKSPQSTPPEWSNKPNSRLAGSSWCGFQWQNKTIYVDPWSRGNYENIPPADLILINDVHSDHMDPEQIA